MKTFDEAIKEHDSPTPSEVIQESEDGHSPYGDLKEPYAQLLKQAKERRDYYESTGRETPFEGWSTGFEEVNSILSGISRNALFLLGGAPGVGKTSLAIHLADAISEQIPVLYLTFENRPLSLAEKLFCADKRINISTLQTGRTPSETMEELEEFCIARSQVDQNLHIISGSTLEDDNSVNKGKETDIGAIKGKMEDLSILEGEPDLYGRPKACLIVDYLQLWAKRSVSKGTTQRTTRDQVESMANGLYDLAQEKKIAIIAISSLNRMSGYGDGSRYNQPRDTSGPLASLSSLKESGDLEYTADSVMILTEEGEFTGEEAPKQIRLDVLKNRYGSRGGVTFDFYPSQSRWKERERVY